MTPRTPPFISPVTVERRTMLRWLGNTAVLTFGGNALSACFGKSLASGFGPDGGDRTGTLDGLAELPASSEFPFQPSDGQGELFTDWKSNTVDTQNLADILSTWSLAIGGMVAKPLVLAFADLLALERQDQVTDFHCVEGWSVDDVPWNGVPLSRLLDLAGADSAATNLTFHSFGEQYLESLSMPVAREARTLLGYGIGGSTLPLAHGFPVRLVVPRLLGYKNAKCVSRIEVTDHPETGYWESYGYPYEGEVPTSRLRPGKY